MDVVDALHQLSQRLTDMGKQVPGQPQVGAHHRRQQHCNDYHAVQHHKVPEVGKGGLGLLAQGMQILHGQPQTRQVDSLQQQDQHPQPYGQQYPSHRHRHHQHNKIRAFEPFLDHHNRPHFLSLDCTTKRGRKVKQKLKSPHRF